MYQNYHIMRQNEEVYNRHHPLHQLKLHFLRDNLHVSNSERAAE